MANSQGDPRVLFAMNLLLSAALATGVVWGLSFLGTIAFGWVTVALLTVLLMIVTYVVVW